MKAINMEMGGGNYRLPLTPGWKVSFRSRCCVCHEQLFLIRNFSVGKKIKFTFLTFHGSILGCKVRAQLWVENRDKLCLWPLDTPCLMQKELLQGFESKFVKSIQKYD